MHVSHGWLSQHGTHALTLAGPALLIALLAMAADARAWLRTRGRELPALPLLVAAGLSLAAGAVHALVCPEHFHEGLLYGQFFAVSAVGQVVWAGFAVLRPRGWVLASGLAANLAVVILWVVTRTAGIPMGPEAGEVEAVGVLDVASSAFEAVIVICCAWTLYGTLHDRRDRRALVPATS